MANEREVPKYILDDLLFRRRLERNLNDELQRLNKLLREQIEMLQQRKELSVEVNAAVMQRWKNENDARPESADSTTEEARQ